MSNTLSLSQMFGPTTQAYLRMSLLPSCWALQGAEVISTLVLASNSIIAINLASCMVRDITLPLKLVFIVRALNSFLRDPWWHHQFTQSLPGVRSKCRRSDLRQDHSLPR